MSPRALSTKSRFRFFFLPKYYPGIQIPWSWDHVTILPVYDTGAVGGQGRSAQTDKNKQYNYFTPENVWQIQV